MTPERAELIALLHATHILAWGARPHRCKVPGCPGDTGTPPASDTDIWEDGAPPPSYHQSPGRAVDLPPPGHPMLDLLRRRDPGPLRYTGLRRPEWYGCGCLACREGRR